VSMMWRSISYDVTNKHLLKCVSMTWLAMTDRPNIVQVCESHGQPASRAHFRTSE